MVYSLKFLSVYFIFSNLSLAATLNRTCGVDYSPHTHVQEGEVDIGHYPWLGVLIYPKSDTEYLTTGVVLVTTSIVLGDAKDIDKFPKDHFRAISTVTLGHNCSGPRIPIMEYTYHPDYKRKSFTSLAMIQLDISDLPDRLYPICAPPTAPIDFTMVFTIAMSEDCRRSQAMLYKMTYVSPEQCDTFYRRSGMDGQSIWPTHTACARAASGGNCVWRSGAVLVSKVGTRWYLLGFALHGPGCQSPARFLDYGMYFHWVDATISRIGRPAITRLGDDHIVLRRSLSNVQRFGPCELEETKTEIYTDEMTIDPQHMGNIFSQRRAVYNVTIYANVEYSCVVFRVYRHGLFDDETPVPKISLLRWCTSPISICYDTEMLLIEFYVEIIFRLSITFRLNAYGTEIRLIDKKKMMAYSNRDRKPPQIVARG